MPGTPIKLSSITNIRDLSPIMNKEGRKIKPCHLYRSESLSLLSEEEIRMLYEDYQLRTILDLRGPIEQREQPDVSYKDVTHISCLLQKESHMGVDQDEESKRKRDEYFRRLDELCKKEDFARSHMSEFYRSLAHEDALKGFSLFMKEIKNNENGILWHCSIGRDRAGCATALVLLLLDVEEEEIVKDYLMSNIYLPAFKKEEKTCDAYKYAQEEYIRSFLEEIKKEYGTYETYFEKIGIDSEEKEKIKKKYLGD